MKFLSLTLALCIPLMFAPPADAKLEISPLRDGMHRIHPGDGDYVVMLHGWTSGYDNLRHARHYFRKAGYHVVSLRYPVQKSNPETLLKDHIVPTIAKHCRDPQKRIHFFTQSLGGVLLRAYLKTNRPPNLGHVVMLAPPNRGIEIVDQLGHRRSFARRFGPTVMSLRTGKNSWPQRLGRADFPLGIIMGDTRIGLPITSRILPGADDGVVSFESGHLEGMRELIKITAIHTSLPDDPEALIQARHFIEHGRFAKNVVVPAQTRADRKWMKTFSPKKR